MAALTLVAGCLFLAANLAATTTATAADNPAAPRTVKLDLAIDGLGPKGCDVEIKPGDASCQFKPGNAKYLGKVGNPYHIDSAGKETIDLDVVRTTSADRFCIFEITVREPGQEPTTIRRGLRLSNATPGNPAPVQTLTCFFRSPSKLARANETSTRK
jgi:hypothetical protein